jgi:Spy/CpxP family protein refolding chaperone
MDMNTRRIAAVSLALALFGASGWSAAASPTQSPVHDHGNSMMGGGMMQMHGEMMKAIGDIMLKYADRIQTPPAK